jgi:predicted peroxiredoxin
MQKIVNELISSSIKGVDVYRWKDATWLIFTNETRWVVELTDEGTLWYNYKFFKDVFRYVSITVGTEMDGYIIQWANNFFYKDCAHLSVAYHRDRTKTSNVIKNGIKNVSSTRALGGEYVEKVVEGGIKETQGRGKNHGDEFEWHTRAVIDNGVKEILNSMMIEPKPEFVEEVVNKGIKEVNQSDSIHRQRRAENLIPIIIKDVKPNRVTIANEKMDRFYYDPNCRANFTMLSDIVEEGVKKVKPNIEYSQQSGVFHPDCAANHVKIEKVIEEGVKEIKPSVWTTKRGIEISDLMCSGNTTDISSIVKNGVKNIYPDKDPDVYDWSDEFDAVKVIDNGIKVIPLPDTRKGGQGYSAYYDTNGWNGKPHTEYVKEAVNDGVKLIPLPDPSGDLRGYSDYYNTKEDRTKPHTEYVKDAIERGVKL